MNDDAADSCTGAERNFGERERERERERAETKDCSPSVKRSTSTHDTDW
jgi:hypothetical protein